MRKLLIIAALGVVAWQAYDRYVYKSDAANEVIFQEASPPEVGGSQQQVDPLSSGERLRSDGFRCDGRKYCSQMTSCEEAKFFLKNCPGVKMDGPRPGEDGPGDGVPCESQWCFD